MTQIAALHEQAKASQLAANEARQALEAALLAKLRALLPAGTEVDLGAKRPDYLLTLQRKQ